MAFPAAFIDELIVRNPIEDVVSQYVELKRKGGRLFGLCPFHGEKTASFSVSPDAQLYYCFGCHKGGGVINFIMDVPADGDEFRPGLRPAGLVRPAGRHEGDGLQRR